MIKTEMDFNDRQNISIFQLISDNGKKDITKEISKLIKNGKDINKSKNGVTPLHISIKLGNYKLTKFLIENGADKNIRNNFNQSLIELTMIGRNSKIIDLIFSNNYDKNVAKGFYQELLFEKVDKSEKRLILHALKRRGQLNIIDKYNRIPIFCLKKSFILNFLLKCQINFESKNSIITKIILSLNHSDHSKELLTIIKLLLKKVFINKNSINNNGSTALIMASTKVLLM